MTVLYSKASKRKKKEAVQAAAQTDEEVFCPLCGYEAKLIEIYKDRKSYKCTKCTKISTFTALPENLNTPPKTKKPKENQAIVIRDRSKEIKQTKPNKKEKIQLDTKAGPKEILQSMENKQVLTFEYRSKDGTKSIRNVEPYKITKDRQGNIILYAFCLEGEGIRVFKLNGMKNIKSTEYTYKPRWPVENELREGKKKPV